MSRRSTDKKQRPLPRLETISVEQRADKSSPGCTSSELANDTYTVPVKRASSDTTATRPDVPVKQPATDPERKQNGLRQALSATISRLSHSEPKKQKKTKLKSVTKKDTSVEQHAASASVQDTRRSLDAVKDKKKPKNLKQKSSKSLPDFLDQQPETEMQILSVFVTKPPPQMDVSVNRSAAASSMSAIRRNVPTNVGSKKSVSDSSESSYQSVKEDFPRKGTKRSSGIKISGTRLSSKMLDLSSQLQDCSKSISNPDVATWVSQVDQNAPKHVLSSTRSVPRNRPVQKMGLSSSDKSVSTTPAKDTLAVQQEGEAQQRQKALSDTSTLQQHRLTVPILKRRVRRVSLAAESTSSEGDVPVENEAEKHKKKVVFVLPEPEVKPPPSNPPQAQRGMQVVKWEGQANTRVQKRVGFKPEPPSPAPTNVPVKKVADKPDVKVMEKVDKADVKVLENADKADTKVLRKVDKMEVKAPENVSKAAVKVLEKTDRTDSKVLQRGDNADRKVLEKADRTDTKVLQKGDNADKKVLEKADTDVKVLEKTDADVKVLQEVARSDVKADKALAVVKVLEKGNSESGMSSTHETSTQTEDKAGKIKGKDKLTESGSSPTPVTNIPAEKLDDKTGKLEEGKGNDKLTESGTPPTPETNTPAGTVEDKAEKGKDKPTESDATLSPKEEEEFCLPELELDATPPDTQGNEESQDVTVNNQPEGFSAESGQRQLCSQTIGTSYRNQGTDAPFENDGVDLQMDVRRHSQLTAISLGQLEDVGPDRSHTQDGVINRDRVEAWVVNANLQLQQQEDEIRAIPEHMWTTALVQNSTRPAESLAQDQYYDEMDENFVEVNAEYAVLQQRPQGSGRDENEQPFVEANEAGLSRQKLADLSKQDSQTTVDTFFST